VDFEMPDTSRAAEGQIQDIGKIIQVKHFFGLSKSWHIYLKPNQIFL